MMVNSLNCDPEVARLVEENRKLVFTVMRNMGMASLPRDEIEVMAQEGMIGLYKAAKTYDETKGSFSTHACWWIRGALSHVANLYCTKRRTPEKRTVSIHIPIYHSTVDGEAVRLEDVLVSDADVEKEVLEIRADELDKLIEGFDIPHKDLLMEHLNGKKQVELAAERGVTRQCISRQIADAKRALAAELRRMGFEAYK